MAECGFAVGAGVRKNNGQQHAQRLSVDVPDRDALRLADPRLRLVSNLIPTAGNQSIATEGVTLSAQVLLVNSPTEPIFSRLERMGWCGYGKEVQILSHRLGVISGDGAGNSTKPNLAQIANSRQQISP